MPKLQALMGQHLKLILAALAGLILVVLMIRAFSGDGEKVSYLTETVRRGDIVKMVSATGEVAAAQLVSVGAQASGQIQTLAVQLGQVVKKGDLIAEIDSTTQRNELAINQARLNTYEAQLTAREVALKVAESQYEREKKLKTRDAASEESLENAENTLAAARAGVDEIKSLITQTRISVNTAETNLGYTRILAPMDGTVVSIPVEEGQTVNANQTTPTIIQLADLSQMEIRMQISEGDVTKVKPGLTVSYTILSEPEQVFQGTLASIDPGLTTLSDGSSTASSGSSSSTASAAAVYYYAKLVAPNPDGTLRIGMTTQNTIIIGEAKDALMAPAIAVNIRDNQYFVQVLENGRAVVRPIKIGLTDNLNTQVLEGLAEGEQVVAAQMTSSELAAGSAKVRAQGGPPRL